MSSKKLIIIASLLSFCLCLPQKKSCTYSEYKNDVVEYVKCVKTLTGSIPYGKRSVPQPSPFLQKLQEFLRKYEEANYSDNMLYRLLKTEHDE